MFGKTLVGLVALLVIGVGGYLYLDNSSCPNHLPATCPSQKASVASCCASEEEGPSCCGASVSRESACCELGTTIACEELTVLPREVK